MACKLCIKLFYHPKCLSKHKIYDRNRELVTCPGPFEKFILENNKEMDMKKAPTPTGSSKDRLESTESVERSGNKASGESGSLNLDTKIDWLIKSVEEMKDEAVCKREIKIMIKDVVREEIGSIKKKWKI